MAHRFVDATEVELTNGTFRRIRAALGVRAFGINQVELPPNQSGFEHDETESNQDEVYVIVAGGGRMTVGGDEIELVPGRFVYVSPEETRCLHSGPDGLSWIVVGASHETPYHPKGFF
jgi:mannose-6-phosphate isomerase-like protein (cupin superfamily)